MFPAFWRQAKKQFGFSNDEVRSGIHPYSAWNGELPGTLPYAVALGETPSGLLNANMARLPKDYFNQMLCTIWEESTIVRISFEEKGVSVTGETEVIIAGGEDFRPVAFAADSKGNVFFTDWALRDYPNHGKGKIWKLQAKEDVAVLERNIEPFQARNQINQVENVHPADVDFSALRAGLQSNDPFMVHASVLALTAGEYKDSLISSADDSNPDVRLGVLLALQKSKDKEVEYLAKEFLTDNDPKIRNSALNWIGKAGMKERREDLELAVTSGETSTALFETYVETVKLLQPDFIADYRTKKDPNSKSLKRELPENFISSIITNPAKPIAIRAFALRYLHKFGEHKDLLLSFLQNESLPKMRLEVIHTVQNYPDKDIADQLLEIALNKNNQERFRSDALLAFSARSLENWEAILPLLDDNEENVALEAARFLRSKASDENVKKAFEDKLATNNINEPMRQQLILGLNAELPERPDKEDEKQWQVLLEGNGSVERGRRVFYSNTSLCSTCHAMEGRGGDLGPELTNVGKSKGRNQLISSILDPSAEMGPEWQGWYIRQKDATLHQGRQIDVGGNNIRLFTQAEGFINVEKNDIEEYGIIKESLMPEGLEKRLTDQDIRDLLVFLNIRQQKSFAF